MTVTSHLPLLSSVPPARRQLLAIVALTVVVVALAFVLGARALQRAGSTAGPAAGFAPLGSSAESSTGGAGTAGSSRDGAALGLGAPSVSPPAGSGTAKTAADAAGTGSLAGVVAAKIARSAWLGIKVTDLTGSAARARVIATGAGGQVTSENVVTSI